MQRCSYPKCGYSNDVILNRHAKTHGFKTTREMEKVHGKSTIVTPSSEIHKWAHKESYFDATFNS